MFFKARVSRDDNIADNLDELLNGQELDTLSYECTYSTSKRSVKPGDLVIVRMKPRYAEEQNRLAVVTELLTGAKADDFDFQVKPVVAIINADEVLKKAQNQRRKEELMHRMETRAQQLSQLEKLQALAKNDGQLADMLKAYQAL